MSPEKKYTLDFEIDITIAGISRKTIEKIIKAWYESGNAPPKIKSDLPLEDELRLIELMESCIREEGGDISRQAKVVHLGLIYIKLNKKGKERFLRILASKFDIDTDNLNEKINNLKQAKTEIERVPAELLLREALIPPRVKLLRQLITLPNGFIFLKDMRRDLLPMIKSIPRLVKLDNDIKRLLVSYFDVNLLDLVEITWDSPAALLEKLMEYEAVHEIQSWNELKHRLFTDHRVFAFFHPKMPNDPLIFLEVALVKGMPNKIQNLIDINAPLNDPYKMDTAIFYSISNTQRGLTGISYGNFLIKRVVEKLSEEIPNIKTYATLSPIPKFCEWLIPYLKEGGNPFFKPYEENRICKISGLKNASRGLQKILRNKNWYKNKVHTEAIKFPMMRLCTHYLIYIKKKGRAYDPVTHFHLMNGAKIQLIHWLANTSEKGIEQSAGIMVNYHYRLNKIVVNHEHYMTTGKAYASKDARSWLA